MEETESGKQYTWYLERGCAAENQNIITTNVPILSTSTENAKEETIHESTELHTVLVHNYVCDYTQGPNCNNHYSPSFEAFKSSSADTTELVRAVCNFFIILKRFDKGERRLELGLGFIFMMLSEKF